MKESLDVAGILRCIPAQCNSAEATEGRPAPAPNAARTGTRLGLGQPRTAQQLDIDRAVGIEACGLGTPDRQRVADLSGIEQLDAAQLHQFGVALTLRPAFLCGFRL
jgi:hypothetical protein